jgi:hypothetical protein
VAGNSVGVTSSTGIQAPTSFPFPERATSSTQRPGGEHGERRKSSPPVSAMKKRKGRGSLTAGAGRCRRWRRRLSKVSWCGWTWSRGPQPVDAGTGIEIDQKVGCQLAFYLARPLSAEPCRFESSDVVADAV